MHEVELGSWVLIGKEFTGLDDGRAVWLLQGDPKGYAFPRLVDKGVEISDPEGSRNKVRIQGGGDGWFSEIHKHRDDQGKAGLSSIT